MNQNKQVLTWLLVAVLGGAVLGSTFSMTRSTQAQQVESSRKEKWEYCAITGTEDIWNTASSGATGATATITYFESGGRRLEKIEYRPAIREQYRDYQSEARAMAISKLGEAGWEMVDVPATGENAKYLIYHFKRPKL